MKITIRDANGKVFTSKGKPAIWLSSDLVPIFEVSNWEQEYTQEEYDELPHEDFEIINIET